MTRLLLDEGLPHPAAEVLRQLGHDAVHTNEIGLGATDDVEILDAARAEGRAIVTLDADFHALIAVEGARDPSVVRIRIEGLHWQPLAELIARVVNAHQPVLEAGALLSVRKDQIRVRRLPVHKQV